MKKSYKKNRFVFTNFRDWTPERLEGMRKRFEEDPLFQMCQIGHEYTKETKEEKAKAHMQGRIVFLSPGRTKAHVVRLIRGPDDDQSMWIQAEIDGQASSRYVKKTGTYTNFERVNITLAGSPTSSHVIKVTHDVMDFKLDYKE